MNPYGMDMNAMMSNPAVQAMLGNEEFMRSMLENNPTIQRMAENNPELGHALRNPSVLRDMMNVMRNPAAMQEFQRNADRAMLGLENHPEGWRMLQSLYHQMDDNLGEPSTGRDSSSEDTSSASSNNASQSSSNQPPPTTPNTDALPNPWAPRGTASRPLHHCQPISFRNLPIFTVVEGR